MEEKKKLGFWKVLLCVLLFFGIVDAINKIFPRFEITAAQPTQSISRKPEPPLIPKGEININLGRRGWGFGSTGQAKELLAVIKKYPKKASYTITYQTDVDTVVFGCDFNKDAIVRIHQDYKGGGTGESWKGYVMDRLKNASKGGSLNDTPEGKIQGTMKGF